ncbi:MULTISPECIES: hypothetical protein [Microbacterium]|jgi:hypothetical protein|uniref:Uncharacterized protein n=1 Tax=Microbacterium mcarthurae TaxID=3035918 RepID=A0ABW9GFP9_9MICO|nr:hypothetical protein [Microbacterium sp. ACRRU]MCG7418182.1 hypothetical protein [Microbacterium sp. ACRRU]
MTSTRTPTIAGVLILAALGLAGCSGETPAPNTPAPTVSTASATPTSDAQSDEASLPLPVDEISDWAETAVPPSEGTALTGRLAGWLSQNTSPHQRNSFETLPAGTYQAQLACRGSGTITLSAGELDDDSATATTTCTNSTIAFDVSIAGTGMTIDLDLDGDPTIYAISLIKMA